MDIKVGRGAWFKTVEEAETVAKYLVQTGKLIGMNMTATVTDMNSPLGRCVGNSLEVWDALETLRGRGRKEEKRQESCWVVCCYDRFIWKVILLFSFSL